MKLPLIHYHERRHVLDLYYGVLDCALQRYSSIDFATWVSAAGLAIGVPLQESSTADGVFARHAGFPLKIFDLGNTLYYTVQTIFIGKSNRLYSDLVKLTEDSMVKLAYGKPAK